MPGAARFTTPCSSLKAARCSGCARTGPYPSPPWRKTLRQERRTKIVVGDGAVLCYNALKAAGVSCVLAPEALRMQDAVGVCQCAEAAAQAGRLLTAQNLQPVYLRLSQAERERLAKEKENTSPQ